MHGGAPGATAWLSGLDCCATAAGCRLRACEVFRRARAGVRKGVDQGAMHSRSSGYGEHLQRRAAPFRAHERVWRNASQVLRQLAGQFSAWHKTGGSQAIAGKSGHPWLPLPATGYRYARATGASGLTVLGRQLAAGCWLPVAMDRDCCLPPTPRHRQRRQWLAGGAAHRACTCGRTPAANSGSNAVASQADPQLATAGPMRYLRRCRTGPAPCMRR